MPAISPREILLGSTADRRVLVLAAEASNIAYVDGTLRGPNGERLTPDFASGFITIQTGFGAEVWKLIRPTVLNVPGDPSNTFFRAASSSEVFGSAEALVLQSEANSKEFILAFRGTALSELDFVDWPDIDDYLAEFFQPLLFALSLHMPPDARLIVTGHSLGAYAAGALAETGATYGVEYVNAIYVPFATPGAGGPSNVLEFGFQNDNVFEFLNAYSDQPAAADYFYWLDPHFDIPTPIIGFHDKPFYSEAAHRLATSAYAGLMTRDDVVVFANEIALVNPFTKITMSSFSSQYAATGRAFVLGSDVSETILGGTLTDFIEGRAGTDILVGDLGNDVLDGGDGNDTLTGGGGNDTLQGGAGLDSAHYAGAANEYTVTPLGGGRFRIVHNDAGADGTDTLSGIEEFYFAGVLVPPPPSTQTTIFGTGRVYSQNFAQLLETGDDVLAGTAGNDTIQALSGNDIVFGGDGNDQIAADWFGFGDVGGIAGERDFIYGEGGDDTLLLSHHMDGGDGNDLFNSRGSNPYDWTVVGGAGIDTLDMSYTLPGDNFVAGSGANVDLSSGSGTFSHSYTTGGAPITRRVQYSSIERFILTFDSRNDVVIGGSGDDDISSTGGIDQIWGGGGDDTVTYQHRSANFHGYLEFHGGEGDDFVNVAHSWTSNRNGSDDHDLLYGDAGADWMLAGYGNDLLDGGEGDDRLEGLWGDDTLLGGGGADIIYAGDGNDVITPGAGVDLVDGGAGFDAIDYSLNTSALFIQAALIGLTLDDATGRDTLYGIERIIGSGFADTIMGSAVGETFSGGGGNDVLAGAGGADTLIGGDGNDTLNGGDGVDTASYSSAVTGVTVNLALAGAQNTVAAGSDTLVLIENLDGSAFNDVLTGDTFANQLTGGLGADALHGGIGDDVLIGGGGGDVLTGGDGNDVIAIFAMGEQVGDVIDGGLGTDALQFGIVANATPISVSLNDAGSVGALPGGGTYQGIEAFYLVGGTANDAFIGSSLTDYMYGGMGDDVLSGGRGNDFIYGLGFWPAGGSPFDGVDTLSGGEGDDTIYGYGGADIIDGGSGNDLLLGDDGTLNHVGANPQADIMFGRDGNDQMYGEDGNDQLDGGAGNDFQSGGIGDDTLLGGAGADTILDEAGATGVAAINAGTGDDHITLSGAFLSGVVNGSVGLDQLTASGVLSGLTFLNIETLNTSGGVVTATAAQLRLFSTIQNSGSNTTGPITLILSTGGQLNLTNKAVGRDVHLTGSATIDVLTGSTGNDVIDGGAGGDTLNGAGGNDTLTGGDGLDTLDGGIGDDVIHGGAGNDVITGGDGNDVITDTGGTVVSISGGLGDDVITLGTASSGTVNGGVGVDEVNASAFLRSIVFTGVETLNTGGLLVTATAAQMEVFDTIRVSAVDATGAVSLRLSEAGLINLAGELGTRAVTFTGSAGNDTITTGDGADTITGGAGDDTLNGRQGNDLILQGSTDGRDIVDGGAGHDTWRLTGTAAAETFRIYTRAEALAAGMTGLGANTEIVITKDGTDNAAIIAELDNVEEIEINSLLSTANNGNGTVDGGSAGGDTILVIGDFTTTSLDYSTIRIAGSSGDDTIDISGLSSAHRVVFTSNGGEDAIIGTPRPQDVFEGMGQQRRTMLGGAIAEDLAFRPDGLEALFGLRQSLRGELSGRGVAPELGRLIIDDAIAPKRAVFETNDLDLLLTAAPGAHRTMLYMDDMVAHAFTGDVTIRAAFAPDLSPGGEPIPIHDRWLMLANAASIVG